MLNHPKTVKCMLYPLLNLKNTYTPCTFSFISKKRDHPFKALKFNGMIIPNFEVFECKKKYFKKQNKTKKQKKPKPPSIKNQSTQKANTLLTLIRLS